MNTTTKTKQKFTLFTHYLHDTLIEVVKVIAYDSITNEYTCKRRLNGFVISNVKESELSLLMPTKINSK